ncbi:5688_t:CDS:2 [Funneliformis geosporum]|uniref:19143_t:CDS:1 n=1 Tax=Funneliformis geosporum TaxID=1117311 RepID=A0A9W4SVT5_9GLOM|nr:5688_t:CDS:2 [Funneliformis geosporum]CAI2182695.1 19143_t:CDS:2 [Funneliformis geosporum]
MVKEDQHHLVKTTDHNHAAEVNRINVIKATNMLKERSQQTNDNPAQVIQAIVNDTS